MQRTFGFMNPFVSDCEKQETIMLIKLTTFHKGQFSSWHAFVLWKLVINIYRSLTLNCIKMTFLYSDCSHLCIEQNCVDEIIYLESATTSCSYSLSACLPHRFLCPEGRGLMKRLSNRSKCSQAFHCLHIVELWVTTLVCINFIKPLLRWMNNYLWA